MFPVNAFGRAGDGGRGCVAALFLILTADLHATCTQACRENGVCGFGTSPSCSRSSSSLQRSKKKKKRLGFSSFIIEENDE